MNYCVFPGCTNVALGNTTSCAEHRVAIVTDPDFETTPEVKVEPPEIRVGMLHGPVGEFVERMAPYTEAHRAAVYGSCLAFLGALIGNGPYFYQGAVQKAKLYVCTIGLSGESRKTAGANVARLLLRKLDPRFNTERVMTGGVSSGEGVLELIRDPEYDENERLLRGTPDQRLVLLLTEFANLLKNGQRAGNSTADIVRQAWDCDPMRMIRRADPALSSNHHVSIVANITGSELFKTASSVDFEGGLLNRFLYLYSAPERYIACPEPPPDDVFAPVERLRRAIERARTVGRVTWTQDARNLWEEIYPGLRENRREGRIGDLLSRQDTHPVRVGFLLALLDGRDQLDIEHINAGVALQEYVEDSIVYCWEKWGGSSAVDSGIEQASRFGVAAAVSRILDETKVGEYYNRRALHRLFKNKSAFEIQQLMDGLVHQGFFASDISRKTGGRPSKGWRRVR